MNELIDKYAIMRNPEEIVFTPERLEAFIKAVSAYTLTDLNTEILKHVGETK